MNWPKFTGWASAYKIDEPILIGALQKYFNPNLKGIYMEVL
jgi:hypothetical protein